MGTEREGGDRERYSDREIWGQRDMVTETGIATERYGDRERYSDREIWGQRDMVTERYGDRERYSDREIWGQRAV